VNVIYTLGHSTRSLDELAELLHEAGVHLVADVRRFPASRRHPHFEREALARALSHAGIAYAWLGEALGGRVPELLPAERSQNRAWTEPAFRRYADAMTTPRFRAGLAELEARARERTTALLCAERLWWRCHRRLLADGLRARGWRVVHLERPGRAQEHVLTEWAQVEGEVVTYPGLL